MKIKNFVYLLLGIFGFGFVFLVTGFDWAKTAGSSKLEENGLILKLNASKQNYIKGEIVSLNIKVTNTSSSDISLRGANVESGYLKIFVSPINQEFRQYINGGMRTKTGSFVIRGGETIESQATILWNSKPDIKNLSDNAVKIYKDSQLMTTYAFPNAGIYLIKAVLIIPGETQTKIESEPMKIVVSEPVGDDLKVWNLIKDKGEIGYFIQQNEMRLYKPEEREKLLDEIKQIVSSNPNSLLAGQMKQKLEKFRIDEEKRKEMLEKQE